MQWLSDSLGTCWASVSAQLPELSAQLSNLHADISRRLGGAGLGGGGAGQVLELGQRRFRVARKLGEGGYAFVYLVHELPTPQCPLVPPEPLALKQVLVGSSEQLAEARHEVGVMQRLRHPNLLPLLDSATVEQVVQGGGTRTALLMLLPLYEAGNLWDAVQAEHAAGRRLPLRDVLSIFVQVCAGLQAMHDRELAHRDVKPHNVLLRRPHRATDDAGPPSPAGTDADHSPTAGGEGYEAVLTDFGSARPAHVVVHNRGEAVALQEDAERHCSAPYRAPELWDVPSSCTLDERVDVWSLGCLLFYMLHASSPFELATAQGGSLTLAVLNGRFPWPDQPPAARHHVHGSQAHEPQNVLAVRQLVEMCLQTDAAARPHVREVRSRAEQLLSECIRASRELGRSAVSCRQLGNS